MATYGWGRRRGWGRGVSCVCVKYQACGADITNRCMVYMFGSTDLFCRAQCCCHHMLISFYRNIVEFCVSGRTSRRDQKTKLLFCNSRLVSHFRSMHEQSCDHDQSADIKPTMSTEVSSGIPFDLHVCCRSPHVAYLYTMQFSINAYFLPQPQQPPVYTLYIVYVGVFLASFLL